MFLLVGSSLLCFALLLTQSFASSINRRKNDDNWSAISCTFLENKNISAPDIKPAQFIASKTDCCNLCGETASCTAAVYINYYCHLKKSYDGSELVNVAGSFAIVRTTPAPATLSPYPQACSFVPDFDIVGGTIAGPLPLDTAGCCALCEKTPGCLAGVWDASDQNCSLKNSSLLTASSGITAILRRTIYPCTVFTNEGACSAVPGCMWCGGCYNASENYCCNGGACPNVNTQCIADSSYCYECCTPSQKCCSYEYINSAACCENDDVCCPNYATNMVSCCPAGGQCCSSAGPNVFSSCCGANQTCCSSPQPSGGVTCCASDASCCSCNSLWPTCCPSGTTCCCSLEAGLNGICCPNNTTCSNTDNPSCLSNY